ncbi:RNA helicase [Malassezia yamatoensis]|uniref:ATP-dependent RNA helicase n=1 Tax=Malassezia yamatoensis TaxID=253288 RepID=A0AAJ6CGH5_9BASI|nr:RNA helicase [Malassezia yamatoensis]
MPGAARKGDVHNTRTRASRALKRKRDQQELEQLERECAILEPNAVKTFAELPISAPTKAGLKRAGFLDMTEIQSKAIPYALQSRDVLGAARTGSGKTLAFLIPVLEMLYRKRWSSTDGLGALIVSPTRELAMQIFEVLRQIGGRHTFSAGLVIGGKDLKHEQDRLRKMNILVATPGRLLQHLDQTVGFDCSNLQILVLDEADRILDMGFANTLNAVLEHLPASRQTLLFSATQTRRVKDLARLSLEQPEYIATQETDSEKPSSTPAQLEQFYMVVPLDKKLDTLYSFLRTHTQSKILVFLSSCRQVQYVDEVFRKLRPGLPVMALHGKQKQTRRLKIFQDYTRSKHAALFATDIAARGLDFPAIDWVLQVDAPESPDTYIHRVGRTARYQAEGKALLFLLPSETDGVLEKLQAIHVPITEIKAKQTKIQSIENQLQSFAFQDSALKHLAQKAFVSYVRSIHLHKDKQTFSVAKLPLNEFAAALGLAGAPKIKIVKDAQKAQRAQAALDHAKSHGSTQLGDTDHQQKQSTISSETSEEESSDLASDVSEHETDSKPAAEAAKEASQSVRTKHDRLFGRQNQTILSKHYAEMIDQENSKFDLDDDDGDLLTLKRAGHDLEEADDDSKSGDPIPVEDLSKRKLLQGRSKKAMAAAGKRGKGDRIVFDDQGNARSLYELQNEETFRQQGDVHAQIAAHEAEERQRMAEADVLDKERAKRKRQEKKRRQKEIERQLAGSDSPRQPDATGLQELDPDDLVNLVLPDEHQQESSSDEDMQPEQPKRSLKRAKTSDASLAEQEAAALALLGN